MTLFALLILSLLLRLETSSFTIFESHSRTQVGFLTCLIIFTVNRIRVEYLRRDHFSMCVVRKKSGSFYCIVDLFCASDLSF